MIDDNPAIDAESNNGEEIDELDKYEIEQSNSDDSVAESIGVAPENADDEILPPNSGDSDDEEDSDSSDKEVKGVRTRSGCTSRLRNLETEFPSIYGDANVAIEDMKNPICLCAYYQNKELKRHIGPGVTYPASFFTSEIEVTEFDVPVFEEQISSLEGVDQHALYAKAMSWFDFDLDEVSSISFKAK